MSQGIRLKTELNIFTYSAPMLLMMLLGLCVELSHAVSLTGKLYTLLLFWVCAIVYGLFDIKNRFGYLLFVAMLFVFLISRPFFASFYNVMWDRWSYDIISTAFILIYVSIAGLVLSCMVSTSLPSHSVKCDLQKTRLRSIDSDMLHLVLLAIVVIAALANAVVGIKHYSLLKESNYADMYLAYNDGVNPIIRGLSDLFPISVATYLSVMPRKRVSIIILLCYIAMGIPTFLLGNRGSLAWPVVFSVAYFFIRDGLDGTDHKWVTKKLMVAFVVFCVFAALALGAMNYTRDNRAVLDDSSMPLLVDFFYKQGTTFDTVCQGIDNHAAIEALPGDPIYTFGEVTDTIRYGAFSRLLDNGQSLPSGNSFKTVSMRHSLAHRLSYVVLGEQYLQGHGRGSSYIIENYLDWGVLGVFAFSFVIGLFLSNIMRIVSKGSIVINTIVINSLRQIYLMPRSSGTGFISFVFSPHFVALLFVIGVVVLATNTSNKRTSDYSKSCITKEVYYG